MATRKEVNDLYLKYLGRNAEPSGLDYWTSQNLSLSGIEYNIARSPEAQAKTASSTQSTGMFSTDEEDEVIDTEAGGQRDRYGDIIRGVYTGPDTVVFPGQVDYGTIPSDLIRGEIAETQLFRDFISKFGDKLEGKGQAAADWLEALVKYGSGDATLKDMQEVDVSGLMDVEGFEDYYNDIVIVQAPTDNASIYKILKGAGYSDEAINEIERASVDNGRFKGNNVLATILRDLGYEADNWEVQPIKNVGDACRNDDGPGTIANNGQCVTDTSQGTPCYGYRDGQKIEGKRDANGNCVLPDDGTQGGDDGTDDTTFSEEAQKVGKAIKDWVEGQIGQVQDMTVEDVLEAVFGGNGYDPQCELTGEGEEPWDCAGTDGTEGNQCWKDCVSASVLGGIPGLPMPPGNIDVGTVRDLENKVEEIGGTISDIFSAPQGDADDEGFIQRAKDWVLGKIEDIFGGIDDVTPGQITGWITGVLGTTISGIILQEIEGKKNAVIDKINEIAGLPIAPTDDENCKETEYFEANKEKCTALGYVDCDTLTEEDGTELTGGIQKGQQNCSEVVDPNDSTVGCKQGTKDAAGNCICPNGEPEDEDGNCEDTIVDTGVDPRCSNLAFASRNPSLCGEPQVVPEGPGFGKTKCQDRYAENHDQFGECGDCIEGYSRKTEGANCTKDETTGTVDGGDDTTEVYDPDCETDPRPTGLVTFDLQNKQRIWDRKCGGGGDTTTTVDDKCDDPFAKNNGQLGECGECISGYSRKPGKTKCSKDDTIIVGPEGSEGPTYTCNDPNATTNADGSCGPCKAGYAFDTQLELCTAVGVTDPCLDADYAAANPAQCGSGSDCTDCTCAEYAAANPEECGTGGGDSSSGGGGGGGGGAGGVSDGMFAPTPTWQRQPFVGVQYASPVRAITVLNKFIGEELKATSNKKGLFS